MQHRHKPFHRLAAMYSVILTLSIGLAACGEAPSENEALALTVADSGGAHSAMWNVGDQVRAVRWIQTRSKPSRHGPIAGVQRPDAVGTLIDGPTEVTYREPYAMWLVDFENGADGWVHEVYLAYVAPSEPPVDTPVVASVSISPSSLSLEPQQTAALSATLRDKTGTALADIPVTWSSTNTAVATVSSNGLVIAVAVGTASIIGTSNGLADTSSVRVTAPEPAPVEQVVINPSWTSLVVGNSAQLTATTLGADGAPLSGRSVTWTSANGMIASVSPAGLVRAAGVGTTVITATSEGRQGTATVTVTAPPVTTPDPTPAATIFESTWSTATGTSSNAFLDASRAKHWNFFCCDANQNTSIVSASSLGLRNWPVPNVYRVGVESGRSGIATHQIEVALGDPTPGMTRYFRYYLQVAYGDTHGAGSPGNIEHGVETAESGGGDGMNFYRIPRNDGTWFPAYREISSGYRYVADGLRLLKNRTYRMEWSLAYGSSTYQVQVRIYDETGALVATEDNFTMYLPVRDASARLGAERFTYTPAHHRNFRVGTNGPSSNFPMSNMTTENLFLHGAVAVCTTGWCGPYRP